MVLESTQQKNLYGGAVSSKEWNLRNQKMVRDMSRMYHLLNKNEKEIEENMDIVMRENFFLENRMAQLQAEVLRLQSLVENQSELNGGENPSNTYVQNFYLTDNIYNGTGTQACNLDRTHGIVTPMATDSLSRFGYVTDSGYVFIPNGLKLFVKEGNNTDLDNEGNPLMKDVSDTNSDALLDRNKNTFWIRTAKYDTSQSVTEVFGEIHIQIPTEGFQNLHTNTLIVHPYPEGSMRIRDIQYRGYGDQWSRLETYPTDENDNPTIIQNARKLLFQFPNTEMTEIRVLYSQPYWFESGAESHFTYGFQDIALEHRVYTEKICEFVTEIDLFDKGALFTTVMEPEAVPAAGGPQNLTNLVSHSLYYDQELSTPFSFGDHILSDVDKIYIKTTLRKQGDLVPVIRELRVPYEFRWNQN